MTDADRIDELETQLAFLDERVRTLQEALAREVKENLAVHERVSTLEAAVKRLAARVPTGDKGEGEDVGADAETDPVPHSG